MAHQRTFSEHILSPVSLFDEYNTHQPKPRVTKPQYESNSQLGAFLSRQSSSRCDKKIGEIDPVCDDCFFDQKKELKTQESTQNREEENDKTPVYFKYLNSLKYQNQPKLIRKKSVKKLTPLHKRVPKILKQKYKNLETIAQEMEREKLSTDYEEYFPPFQPTLLQSSQSQRSFDRFLQDQEFWKVKQEMKKHILEQEQKVLYESQNSHRPQICQRSIELAKLKRERQKSKKPQTKKQKSDILQKYLTYNIDQNVSYKLKPVRKSSKENRFNDTHMCPKKNTSRSRSRKQTKSVKINVQEEKPKSKLISEAQRSFLRIIDKNFVN